MLVMLEKFNKTHKLGGLKKLVLFWSEIIFKSKIFNSD